MHSDVEVAAGGLRAAAAVVDSTVLWASGSGVDLVLLELIADRSSRLNVWADYLLRKSNPFDRHPSFCASSLDALFTLLFFYFSSPIVTLRAVALR